MTIRIFFVVAAGIVLAVGCTWPSETPDAGPEAGPSVGAAPTAAELGSATYSGIEDQGPVTLSAGKWEGEPFEEGGASVPMVWLSEGFYLSADIDGDGAEEAIAHLTYSTGGTGNFAYLAVLGREDGAIVQQGLAEVGDRVQIRKARIESTRVALDVLQAGPDDGMCCPTQLATRSFAMQGGQFVEAGTEVTGTASPATLEGQEWVLRKLSSTEAAPEGPEVTLVFDDGRLSGTSGCNSYNGGIEPGETATDIAVGPLTTTRKACPPEMMNLEQRYTAALQGAQSWGFHLGQLVINYRQGDSFGSLFFEGREASPGT